MQPDAKERVVVAGVVEERAKDPLRRVPEYRVMDQVQYSTYRKILKYFQLNLLGDSVTLCKIDSTLHAFGFCMHATVRAGYLSLHIASHQ